MPRNNHFTSLISQIQHSTNQPEMQESCEAFCKYSGFDQYLVFGSIFTSFLSPQQHCFDNIRNERKTHLNHIENIKKDFITITTPVISGDLKQCKSLITKTIKTKKNHPLKGVSIAFPVHYPTGRFSLLYISANQSSAECEKQVMDTLALGNIFAREAGNAVFRLLDKEISTPSIQLSSREKQCLLLAADGLTPPQIAEIVGLSAHTVIFHLKKAREKLASKNIQGAVSKAMLRGDIEMKF